MAGAVYAKQVCQIEPGDLLVLFSDGISEASRPDGEDFGEDRLVELLREHRSESAQAIIETVIQRVTEFIAGAPPADDITIVVAKRTA
jgi:phosphoserine phosphatase RsbU/P